MEPPAGCPGPGAGERAQGEKEEAAAAAAEEEQPGERRRPEEEEQAGPPGGEPGEMESWQPLNVEVDNSHNLLASVARLNMRREESDLSEFPSMEEGMLTVSEEDSKEQTGGASCSPLLAIEDTSGSPCVPLLASSPTHKVWNETLFEQSELEFMPLRGIPDLSEVSELHSRRSQVSEALFPSSSSEGPSDFCNSYSGAYPCKAVGISTVASYDTSGMCLRYPRQQVCIDVNEKSASSPDACDEFSRSRGADSVETLASHVSLRRRETSQKPETFPATLGQSMLEGDGPSPLDCRLSNSSLLPCLEKNRLGVSSFSDRSFCESFNYKNLEEYKLSPKLDCLKSDEGKVKRLEDVCCPPFKGELSSKFMSHSLFPVSSQGQPVQNSLASDVNTAELSAHGDCTRTGFSGVAFRSVRFKLDDLPKPGPKEGLDANKATAFHEVVASIEPIASENSSAAVQDLFGVRSDWKQTISPLSSQTERPVPGQLTQPTYQLTPSVFPVQSLAPVASPRSAPVASELQLPFVSPNEELASPNPRNLAVWKSQSPSDDRDVSTCTSRVSPLTHTYSPTLLNIVRYDISHNYPSLGEASQPLASIKDSVLRTDAVMEDDTNIKGLQLSENGIISSGRVAEMLREEKYNMNDLPKKREPLQNDETSRGSTFHSGLTDQVRDGASEHSIPSLTFSQAKSLQSTSTADNKPAAAEPLLADAEVKECQDHASQTPPEKKVYHHPCFFDPHSFVPPIRSGPVPVIEPQVLCPTTLRNTSNVRSNFNSGVSHVSWSIPLESYSHRDLPVSTGTSQHPDYREKTVTQVESTFRQREEWASESTPETFPKSKQAEEKLVSPEVPFATSGYKEDFKIISEHVQRLIDHWDSHLLEDNVHAVPLPIPTPVSVDNGDTKGKPTLSDIKETPMCVDKDGKKGKPVPSDIKETSESESKADKGLHMLLVEAENIAQKRFSSSPSLYPDVTSPQPSRLDDIREVPLTKDSMGLSQRLKWDEKMIPTMNVDTNTVNHFSSQRDTGKASVQETERKARVALKETLRQCETVRSVSRCERDRSSTFIEDEISVPGIPLTSSNSSSDSSDMRVSYIWDPVSDSFFGYLPNFPTHVYMGDIQEREIISDSDDGCSSDDSLAVHVRHLLTCDAPGSLATQMLRDAEEKECRVRARAWNLKFNLATERGDVVTELDEADLRKVEEIKASLCGSGRPLDVIQDLPCPVGIGNVSETCNHLFIETHEEACFRTMTNEQFGGPSQGFRSNESSEMSQRQSTASWSTRCGSHAKSTVQTSQLKAWSFSRSGSHQPFPGSISESHYVNRATPRSFHEEMETLVGSAAVSSQEPVSLSSRPPSEFCSEALKRSQCISSAPVVVQADQGQSPPVGAQRPSMPVSENPVLTSNRMLASSLKKDPVLAGYHPHRVSFDLSATAKGFQEKEPTTAAMPLASIKEHQDLARGSSPKALGVTEKGVDFLIEFPSGISPEEQGRHHQPRNVSPADSKAGPGHSSQTPLSQHPDSPVGKEDQLEQKPPSSNVACVQAESSITGHPDSPTPQRQVSPAPSLSSSPKQRAISYLRITLSPKASNAIPDGETPEKRQHALDGGARTRLNDALTVKTCASKLRSLVPLEPASQELTITPSLDEKEFSNCTRHKTSRPSESLSRQTQVSVSDLDACAHSKGVQSSQGCGPSDHFRNADTVTSLKLLSDAITQITTESSEKTTFSSEIIINSQAHSILNKPSHCPTAQLSLLPYKPSGSAEMYYVPSSLEPSQYPVAKSETTLESSHSGSNDAIAPDFPPEALGTRDENVSDIVTIKHKEGIYSKKAGRKAAWPAERNPTPKDVSESTDQLELENTTHSVFKSAQFYFHHPVHHQHDHDFFSCCEPWGRGAFLAHSRRDKDPCFSPPFETYEDEHRFSPLQTEMDYTRIERYCWNVGGGRDPGAGQRLEENLKIGSKMSSGQETSRIRFSLAQTLEPSATLNELWNRFQERQKKQKPPTSTSSDELSLVDRLDRLAKVLQKPMMLSLQVSQPARDDCREESTQQQRRRKHQLKKKDKDESLSFHRARLPPQSPFGLVGRNQMKPTCPQQPGLDSVSPISSDSRPSPETEDPMFESDVTTQTDGEAGPLAEMSSDVSIIDLARIVQRRMHVSPTRQQKHLSERQREESRKVAKWKKSPPTSPQLRRKGMQVDSVISSDSVSTVSSAWSPSPTHRKKQTVRMLNKGVQTGELEIVRSTRKHTRDFGVTFPTPDYNVTGRRVDKYVNSSSPGSSSEEKKPVTVHLWTKKLRRSQPPRCEGVSWFIPAENLRCSSKKENQSSCVSGPGPSWFAPLTHTKPWRQPLREQNWQTDGRGSDRLQVASPGLSDDKEAHRRFVKAGLQESLERLRPDFISRSGARVKRLRLMMEERKLQRLLQRERDELFNTAEQQRESQDIACFLSKKGYMTMRNRTITKKEMVQRSKRIYEQLPEVRKKREEEQRKSAYTMYRCKAQLYKTKITNRVLGRKVPWD